MSAIIKACIRILITCFVTSSTFGLPSAYNGIKIVTYGEPCDIERHLPIQIEVPTEPVPPAKYQCNPLDMQLKIIPILKDCECPSPVPLPIAIQVPQEEPAAVSDHRKGKLYGYNLEVPITIPQETSSSSLSRSYNFGLEVPVPDNENYTNNPCGKPAKVLTDLVSKVDRILIPACEVPESVKTFGCSACN